MEDNINNFISGLLPDNRTVEEKSNDIQHSEISSAPVLNWNRDQSGAPKLSIRNQNGSGSCVAQATAKGHEAKSGVVASAHPIYARRMNTPGEGMYLYDAGNLINNKGTTTEQADPSQNMTEQQMDAPVTVQTPILEGLPVTVDHTSIDQIAQAIEMWKECKITLFFDLDEYAYATQPVSNGKPATVGHCICATYYFTLPTGEKALWCEESWGPNNIRNRIITQSYLQARGTGAMYNLPLGTPHYQFNNQLHFAITGYASNGNPIYDGAMMNNQDVKALQDILKFEQILPTQIQSTGNYLQLTAQAVLKFQLKYQLDSPDTLNSLAGKRVGPKTLAKLNELYSS